MSVFGVLTGPKMQKKGFFRKSPGLNPQKAIRAAFLTPRIHAVTIDDGNASIVVSKLRLPQQPIEFEEPEHVDPSARNDREKHLDASLGLSPQRRGRLTQLGFRVVVIVAPLLPIQNPHQFFTRVGNVASAVVIDHFIHGDGTPDGRVTKKTALPMAMAQVNPSSVTLAYRDEIVAAARQVLPGRVGVSANGFAGNYS